MAKKEPKAEKPVRKPSKSQGSTQYALCIPSSVISSSNAKNLEQITHIAYQIAKAATIYNAAEIIVLNIPTYDQKTSIIEKENLKQAKLSNNIGGQKIKYDISIDDEDVNKNQEENQEQEESTNHSINESNHLLLATLLQFFITPPYLVNSIFADNKYKNKLKYAKLLPKLSSLPFMCNNNVLKSFREGLTIPKKSPKIQKRKKKTSALKKLSVTNYVNIGKSEAFELTQSVPVNVRVTVDLVNKKVVSPSQAYGVVAAKSSFGYHVRVANSFSSIFTGCSFPEGYTSTLYVESDSYFDSSSEEASLSKIATFDGVAEPNSKVLLVFGNIKDLNFSFEEDKASLEGVSGAHQMFDFQIKMPRSIRIEDAALIALTRMSQI